MAFLKGKWALAAIVFLCWALIASLLCCYYYYQYDDLKNRVERAMAEVNIGIDYGNGTRVWYNGTKAATLYDAMVNAGWKVEGKSYGAMGFFVTSINGIENSDSTLTYWGWWSWTDFGWSHGGSACDKYILSPGETVIWYYSKTDPSTFEMTPPP